MPIPGAGKLIKGLFSDTLDTATEQGIKAQRNLRDSGSDVLQNSIESSRESGASIDEAVEAAQYSIDIRKKQAAMGAKKFEELSGRLDEGTTSMANLISPAFKANSSEINIDMRKNSLVNLFKANMGDIDEALSTRLFSNFDFNSPKFNLLGFDDKAQKEFIKAVLDPEAVVDIKYSKMATEWNNSNKLALDMYQAAGGNMQEITGIGYLPQTHDVLRMRNVDKDFRSKAKNSDIAQNEDRIFSRDKWVEFTKKNIDYGKMKLKYATDEKIVKILRDIYDTITSDGLNKIKALADNRVKILKKYKQFIDSGELKNAADYKKKYGIKDNERASDVYKDFQVDTMTANKRKQHREIHFTPDGWLKYQDSYGSKDIYKTIEDYIQGMSMDIASMQVLGPNPLRTWTKLKVKAADEGKTGWSDEHLQGMFDVATGKTDRSVAGSKFDQNIESWFGGYRSLGVAADLGGATISSFTDVMTSQAAAGNIGMGFRTFVSQIGTIGRRMKEGFKVSEKEKFAQRLGITQNSFMSSIRNNRFSETGGSTKLQKTAEFVLRSSGLTAWTESLRTSFALELSGFLADNFGKNLNSFSFGKQLKDVYGLTNDQWMKITDKYITNLKGVKSFKQGESYIDTTKLYLDNPELALKIMDIINQETHYAVIMPDSRVRSITTGGGASKGTVKGELARTVFMYKSFPVAMMTTQIGRLLGNSMNTTQKTKYAATLIVGGGMMGMGVVQLKELMKGRTAIEANMDDPMSIVKLFGKGLMQSGGLGIFGDLIFSDATRYGGGAVSTAVGKAGQPLENLDTIKKLWQGDNVESGDILSDMVRMGSDYVPGRNLWYTRLLYERAVKDVVMEVVDPDYDKKLRKHLRKLKKDTGQGYWMEPGSI